MLCGTCRARGAAGTSRWTCKLDSLINEHRVSGEMENEIDTVKQSAWRNLLDTGRLLQSLNTSHLKMEQADITMSQLRFNSPSRISYCRTSGEQGTGPFHFYVLASSHSAWQKQKNKNNNKKNVIQSGT